jgi:hypothetical protein
LKNTALPENTSDILVKAIPKYWLEKLKITNQSKVSKLFEDLNLLVEDAVQRLPSEEAIHTVLATFTSEFKQKLDKKMLLEVDVCMAVIVTHFINYKAQLEKSPLAEGIAAFEGEHIWGEKESDRCSYGKVGAIRDALVEKFTEVINLDFPKTLTKISRSVLPKMWDMKQSPIILANLNHAIAIDHFIREIILPIKTSSLFRLGVDFNVSKRVSRLYKAALNLTVKMVCLTNADRPSVTWI